MFKKQSQTVRITLILIGAICLYWAINVAQHSPNNQNKFDDNLQQAIKPSAFLINSTFFLYDTKGQVSEMHAQKAYFYSNTDIIKIDQPSFSSNTKNATRYTLDAKAGDYHPTNETLFLAGGVKAQQFTQDKLIWTLESDELLLDYKTGHISTDNQVSVTQGKHSLNATGIQASMTDKTIHLLSNVRGKYVFDN